MELKNRFGFLVLVILLGADVCLSMAAPGKLVLANLTCDDKRNPVGIESGRPRLSWTILAERRSVKQTAYQIVVADDPEMLKQEKGNVWDSGKIDAGSSIQVPYAGKALTSAKKYYWKVKIWDNQGHVSDWSEPASWQMGLIAPPDWKGAQWIGYDELPNAKRIVPAAHLGGEPEWGPLRDTLPLLRREFTVEKPLKQATIFISGLGHFELRVNGEKIGDHFLDPGWTNYDKTALYVGFDITKEVQVGANALGVMLGNGFYHVPAERYRKLTGTFGHPKMICRLRLEYTDGTAADIISDGSWKAAPGPVIFSSIFGGEDYDARLAQDGWDAPSFDDAAWRDAVLVDGPEKLNSQSTEPLKVMETFAPVKISQPKPGTWVYDLGQNFSGIPAIVVSGKSGDTVKIIPGEILDSTTAVSQRPSGDPSYFTYVLNGKGTESWQPQFTYYGFRYLQIEGAVPEGEPNPKGLPVLKKVQGLHTRNSASTVGEFHCSNELFNQIFNLINWSIRSNMASVLTDCPHREKLGWLEVAHLLGGSIRYNYDIASFYRKIIRDMQLAQTAEGLVPNIAPEWVEFDPDFRDSPEWGSSSVILPWYMYQWYGDEEILRESYPMMKRYVDYLGRKAENHIVSHGLGDWFDIGENGSGSGYSLNTPQGITGTAMYYYDLGILQQVATLLGEHDDASRYHQLSEQVRSAFNNAFFNEETKQYGTGSQTANAMAVYMKLVDPEHKEAVVENLIKGIRAGNNRLTSGEVGFRHLVDVLEAEGKSDVLFDMNNRADVPGYGYQIAHGATTLMEDWTAIKTLGNNHCMLGHLMKWFYSGLGGIRPAENSIAFNKIVICPEPVGDITSAKASYRSPYGVILSEWKKNTRRFELHVEIPPNTDAVIYLPAGAESIISENGKRVHPDRMATVGNGKRTVSVGSGTFRYVVKN
ncbi:family 78 glycoside hydrolase catalytic domain [Parapedobacter sp. DT-150]|uniref:family 78 glycoside hydrolase catalytic domain n=1 Tax=Parapedobacter sp. DT-150 TaxID=3396162 RepID=UPI003F1DD1F5